MQNIKKALPLIPSGILLLSITILIFNLEIKQVGYSDLTVKDGPAPGAKMSLNFIGDVRSYPNQELPKVGFVQAFNQAKKLRLRKKNTAAKTWSALGPTNIGGRTLALAIDPSDPDLIFAGSASGGLWKSTTGGSGQNVWEYVRTGFPVLGVAAIALDPQTPDTMFIGTGESYGSEVSMPGIGSKRTTRGSYGIGILKSKDGGNTWEKSLDWSLDQRRSVQKIQVNPLRSNTIWAATTEGAYRTRDGGENWIKVHDVKMATDIIINPSDTSVVYIANGGMGSLGHGLYKSENAGDSFQKIDLVSAGGPDTFQGKMVLDISASDPDILLVSIGNSDGTIGATEFYKTWLMLTENNGDTWSLISTEDYSRVQGWYAHAAAIHPSNSDIIWAAGQPFTVYKSTNGGGNLSPVDMGAVTQASVYPELTNWADYHDIVFHPTDSDIIYFINDGGVFRTTDGGLTFENCNSGYQTTQFYNGVSNSETTGNLLLGGLQDNSSVIYEGSLEWRRGWSGDGGWTALDPENNNNAYLSAQFGNMVFSSSLFTNPQIGDSYFRPTNSQFPSNETNFITPIILSPADGNTFYIGGQKIMTAQKGNDVWSYLGNGKALDGNAMSAMAGSYQDADVLYVASSPAIGGTSRGNIFVTKNKGTIWTNITGELPDRYPTDLAVDPTNHDIAYVTFGGFNSSHVFKTENAGETWIDIGAGLPDIPTWAVTVDPDFPNHIYVGNEVGIYQSLDGGTTWEDISGNLPDAIFAIELVISNSNRKLRVASHGNGVYEIPLELAVSNEINNNPIPSSFRLKQNYPNPFNPSTNIQFDLNKTENIKLQVFDITGKLVTTLVDEVKSPGSYTVSFDGSNLSSGTYIYRLQADNKIESKIMTLLK